MKLDPSKPFDKLTMTVENANQQQVAPSQVSYGTNGGQYQTMGNGIHLQMGGDMMQINRMLADRGMGG